LEKRFRAFSDNFLDRRGEDEGESEGEPEGLGIGTAI